MTFLSQSGTSSSRHFVLACLGLFICSILSVLHVNLPGGSVSLLLLPLLIVSLWPRGVNSIVSIVTFFLMGMLVDWGTNGAVGQWAMIYLAIFTVLRPDRREQSVNFLGAIGLWGLGLMIGIVMLIVTGWLAYGALPNFISLMKQAMLVSVLMPLVVAIRSVTRYLLTDPHDRGY